jgi:ATP-grasp domain, R2K clade family 2
MPTLLLSTWSLPASKALTDAARQTGWRAVALDDAPDIGPREKVVYYGGTDRAMAAATHFHLALLEPPFDLLARLPPEFRRRAVEFARFGDLNRLKALTFVKPADALDKSFDAGIYSSARDIRAPKGVTAQSPVLVAEPVEWSAEFRCFIREGQVAAWSPYISFGRPTWKPYAPGTLAAQVPASVLSFCDRLFSQSGLSFPPAYVMDVGLIDDRGWAVVEFNPVWCSGVLGADPQKVLAVLERACHIENELSDADRRWVLKRSPRSTE